MRFERGVELAQAYSTLGARVTVIAGADRLLAQEEPFASQQISDALQDKFGKDLQSVVVVPPSGKSKIYHVASAGMTEDQAKAACQSLKKQHQRCEVVKS